MLFLKCFTNLSEPIWNCRKLLTARDSLVILKCTTQCLLSHFFYSWNDYQKMCLIFCPRILWAVYCSSLSMPVRLWVKCRDRNQIQWNKTILHILRTFKVLDQLIHRRLQCAPMQRDDKTEHFSFFSSLKVNITNSYVLCATLLWKTWDMSIIRRNLLLT